MYLAHHFETPSFTNDFALWVGEALQEEALGEKLAAIDLLSFTSIRGLRESILVEVDKAIDGGADRSRNCPARDELHFCRSKSFIMPTGLVADDPQAFFHLLPNVSNVSLFYHFFEARLRLGRATKRSPTRCFVFSKSRQNNTFGTSCISAATSSWFTIRSRQRS